MGQESVTIFNVGPDLSYNQVKLSHAIIYHDNSQKPFMSTPLFQMFRIAWGKTRKVCKSTLPPTFFSSGLICIFGKKWTLHPSNMDPDPVCMTSIFVLVYIFCRTISAWAGYGSYSTSPSHLARSSCRLQRSPGLAAASAGPQAQGHFSAPCALRPPRRWGQAALALAGQEPRVTGTTRVTPGHRDGARPLWQ